MMKKRVTPSFVAIGQGQPGAGKGKALLAVDSELELVHKLVPATANRSTISGDAATRAGALQALENNTWVHLVMGSRTLHNLTIPISIGGHSFKYCIDVILRCKDESLPLRSSKILFKLAAFIATCEHSQLLHLQVTPVWRTRRVSFRCPGNCSNSHSATRMDLWSCVPCVIIQICRGEDGESYQV
jgi:hypothetical protein